MSLSSSTSLNMETESVTSSGKKSMKEGSVQMTSLSTLLSFHRYFFLYHDRLILSKQRGSGSFKLKEKLCLSKVWIASSNTVDSFLLGWPLANYLVHFRSREDKDEWFELLSCCIQQCLKPLFTTVSMDINVRGRKQVIRRRIDNGKKSGELVVETVADLGLPNTSYELKLFVGDNSGKTLQGPENVYAVLMHEIERSGVRISESQKQSLDTCPIASVRLVLSTMKSTKTPTPMQIVNIIKKRVLLRTESKGLLGKEMDAASPPQTILTIVDHLRMDGFDAEGIFRKSPKQSTFKELRQELERGLVPDYSKYSTHVLASMLKEYLRSIPGKILQSGNYDLWMKEVVDEVNFEQKITAARTLLSLLPTSHSILLANVFKLLSKIANAPSSKMTTSALSVCLGPSFLESTDPIEGGKKIPLLIEFLIDNASAVIPGFNSDSLFSILTPVDQNANLLSSPCHSDDESSQTTPIIEELRDDVSSQCSGDDNEEIIDSERGTTEDTKAESQVSVGIDKPLCFSSDSEDEDEPSICFPKFRPSLIEAAAVEENIAKEERPNIVAKIEERKETPRSPCLKRIHFQRTEAQLRSNEMFKFDSRLEFDLMKASKQIESKADQEVPSRKESREEGTQTGDEYAEQRIRFPAFKSSTHISNQINSLPSSPSMVRRDMFSKVYRPRDKIGVSPRQDEKPTVQVHPFNQIPSMETVSERLKQFRDTPKQSPKTEDHVEKRSTNSTSLMSNLRSFHEPNYRAPIRVAEETTHTLPPLPVSISETFSPYCIDPTDTGVTKRSELHRSASQRGEKTQFNSNKELQRAFSVKTVRRGYPADSCVGMDALEINWSVRHLKTLFQDKRAPSINTEYNFP